MPHLSDKGSYAFKTYAPLNQLSRAKQIGSNLLLLAIKMRLLYFNYGSLSVW